MGRLYQRCKVIFVKPGVCQPIVIPPGVKLLVLIMNRYWSSLLILFLAAGCREKKSADPYAEILSQPAFAGITDSIRRFPDKDELFFRRAVLLNTNNFPEPALADFRRAWTLRKEEPYALGIATLLLDKRADSAVLFLNTALNELPGSLLLQLSLAHAYDAQGKLDEALAICNRILADIPLQLDVIKMKADLLTRKGNLAEATRLLEQAYAITPFDVELNYELALKYAEAKNPRVLRLCDSLLKSDTDSSNMHAEPSYFKGIYYSNIDQPEKALALFDEAIGRNYYYLNAYIEKGRVQLKQGKTTEALKTFNLALTISPKFPDAYYWIGKCQEILGQKEEAKLNYLRAYSLDPEFKEAKEAADKLKE